jgi:hypothetical protein
MQDTVDQAPAAARTLAGIIAQQPPAESPAIDQDEQIAVIDRGQDTVGVCDPDPEHAVDPAERVDTAGGKSSGQLVDNGRDPLTDRPVHGHEIAGTRAALNPGVPWANSPARP